MAEEEIGLLGKNLKTLILALIAILLLGVIIKQILDRLLGGM